MKDRHHLLECILWPNGDGTFRKIINTQKRLEELGIYDDYKLTIPIEHGAHSSMHADFKKGTEYAMEGDKNPMYGRTGDKNPMYGRTGDVHPTWKGDSAGPRGLYRRQLERYKNGEITEEELQPFRKNWCSYVKERNRLKKHVS